MTLSSFRVMIQWHLLIAAVAVVAFWTYYQTLDPNTVSTIATTSADTQNAAVQTWLDHQRAWFNHYFHAGTDWRNKIWEGLTTPH